MSDGKSLIAPRADEVLPGISLRQMERLATELGIDLIRRDISVEELSSAEEVLWLSTSVCVLPVTRIDATPIGLAQPGPLFSDLIQAWSDEVDVDIIGQAKSLIN